MFFYTIQMAIFIDNFAKETQIDGICFLSKIPLISKDCTKNYYF